MKVEDILNQAAIFEEAYGYLATVYHRTRAKDLINHVYDSGFKPGNGAMYGKGFYSTYDLKSQQTTGMKDTYGSVVVKFAVKLDKFFFFDWEPFSSHPLSRELGATKKDFLQKQADYYNLGIKIEDRGRFSSSSAYAFHKKMQAKGLNGIIFTGSRDGRVLVAWNTSLINPLAYYIDGYGHGEREWIKADRNLDYLKKWSSSNISQGRKDVTKSNSKNLYELIKDKSKPIHRRKEALETLRLKKDSLKYLLKLSKEADDIFDSSPEILNGVITKGLNNIEGEAAEVFGEILYLLESFPNINVNEESIKERITSKLTIYTSNENDLEKIKEVEEKLFKKLKELNFDFSAIKEGYHSRIYNKISNKRGVDRLESLIKAGVVEEGEFQDIFKENLIQYIDSKTEGSYLSPGSFKIKDLYEVVKSKINKEKLIKSIMAKFSIGSGMKLANDLRLARETFKELGFESSVNVNVINSFFEEKLDSVKNLDDYNAIIINNLRYLDKEELKKVNMDVVYEGMEKRAKKTNDSSFMLPLRFGKDYPEIADYDRLLKIMLKCQNPILGLLSLTKEWPSNSYDCEKIIDLIIKKDKKGEKLSSLFKVKLDGGYSPYSGYEDFKCDLKRDHLKKAIDSLEKSRYKKNKALKDLKELYKKLDESIKYKILSIVE